MQTLKVINKLKKIIPAELKREFEDKGALTFLAEVAVLIAGCCSVFILMILIGA